MPILGLIPARGGSKGILRKNIKPIAGKPLIEWTIEAALAARGVDAVVASTEDPEIAEIARAAGAQVPFLRPVELAADDTPGIDPVLHALEMLPEYDAVLLLQPTSPLRTAADIEALLALVERTGASSAVSVCEPEDHPNWMFRVDDAGHMAPLLPALPAARRQDLPPIYVLNGAIYYADASWLRSNGAFVGPETLGHVMPGDRSVDIDGPLDWLVAETLLAGGTGVAPLRPR